MQDGTSASASARQPQGDVLKTDVVENASDHGLWVTALAGHTFQLAISHFSD